MRHFVAVFDPLDRLAEPKSVVDESALWGHARILASVRGRSTRKGFAARTSRTIDQAARTKMRACRSRTPRRGGGVGYCEWRAPIPGSRV
jgi:hypothetical protein